MVYLDYSTTTPTSEEVLEYFNKTSLFFYRNVKSSNKFEEVNKKLIDDVAKQIKNVLNTSKEIIYTTGSTKSNGIIIRSIGSAYKNRGKHIITGPFEEISIIVPLNHLIDEEGFIVDTVNLDENGMIDLNHLKSLMTEDTILVTIASINSELGILQPISEISKIVKEYPNCFFHCDMTQSIGKVNIPIDEADLVTLSADKFFGLKGIGCILKNKNIDINPYILDKELNTDTVPIYPIISSLEKALTIVYTDFDTKYNHVFELNKYLKENLSKYSKVYINSNDKSIPHILNISVIGIKPKIFSQALEEYGIYIPSKSGCTSCNSKSQAVYDLTHDDARARSSLRISISQITTKEEIELFLDAFEKCYKKLVE